MKIIIALLLIASFSCFAAIPGTTLWELEASATAGNVNSGGFDPAATGMLTDLACTSATGNSPVCSSASYNFAAGDVNAWLYVQSGTNWTPGFYKISSVASNQATVDATIGHAVQLGAANLRYGPSTVAGIATTASPTAGVFTIDYSQQTAAKLALTDVASVGSSTTLTSAAALFTPVMVGNFIHITTTGTGAFCTIGYYEITVYTSATTVTTDRTTNGGTACVAGTGKVGGAISLNTAGTTVGDNVFIGTPTAGNTIFVQSGSYSLAISLAAGTVGGTQNPTLLVGYGTYRGDNPTGTSRPLINTATFAITPASNWDIYNIRFITGSTTALGLITGASGIKLINVKLENTSTTAGKTALTGGTGIWLRGSEVISYRGTAISVTSNTTFIDASYIHGSDIGLAMTTAIITVTDSIFEDNATHAVAITGANVAKPLFLNCTFYGAENKLADAVNMVTGVTDLRLFNSIFYGFTTAIVGVDTNSVGVDNYNNYFNNTADVSAATQWQKGTTDFAVNPSFASVGQYTGTTATSSTNVLTDSGANFANVVDNQDECLIVSGTGTGIPANTHFLITSHTSTTLTLSTNITSSGSGSAITYGVTYGHNFAITNATLKNGGYPGLFPGALTTGYLPIGAVGGNAAGAGGGSFGFVQ